MDLSSLGFFSQLRSRTKTKQYAVIGLGRFGRAVCEALHKQGYDVVGIDSNEDRVTEALSDRIVTHARSVDSTNPAALAEAGVFELDTADAGAATAVEARPTTGPWVTTQRFVEQALRRLG